MRKVLFVCKANIFRSVTAEYCLKKYLSDNNIENWSVSSAGVIAYPEPMFTHLIDRLEKMGIKNVADHKQTKLTKEHLENNDFIIAMARSQKDFIENNFDYKNVFLFTELVGDGIDDVYDIGHIQGDTRTKDEIIDDTVDYIYGKMPRLFKTLSKVSL
jgi:protein-tyrosine-phosphatase